MALPISAINVASAAVAATPIRPIQVGAGAGAADFKNVLADAVSRVDQFQKTAHNGVEKFLSGENEEVHQVALDMQRSELAFDMFVQVRNKMVSAYQEVMRMQM